ncbi:putative fluoride ion transporter CrcB [Methanimicrococcus sp. At1]|uniref:Fluoride-specific ion channel FluC n=1 Tax=Methanimicrococcus hacksteinii TaxID=3028293 RepID=A0ABU3VQT9_9EURY|nr:CrcB family protein [Methanimicrococcus sp. At1]MDV0445777.1 putative fluoride ion transporter CrcB [Methanimicrococcus sp. At1]
MAAAGLMIVYLLAAGIGGAVGAFLRYFAVEISGKYTKFPAGVLIANIIGTFLLALTTLYAAKEINGWGGIFEHIELMTFFFNTGVCGSLTTFSTFSYNNLIYWEEKKYFPLAANILLNIILCTAAVFTAILLVYYNI